MCGLKEIFEGAGNFCDKKVPCKSHFSIREKLNLIRFIKTLYKNLSTHPLRFAQHLLHGRRQTPQSLCDSSPFMGAFQTRKPSLKGKVANRRFDGRV